MRGVRTVHVVIGFAVVSGFALLMLAGLGTGLLRRDDPGRWFWWVVAAMQVAVGVQVIVGVTMLLMGRPQELLHYAYGGLFPIMVLVTAHVFSRMEERPAYVNFAWAAFFCFGLTLRALMTGLGIGG
jgi:hypothetical protein